jgi:hypothetical protein
MKKTTNYCEELGVTLRDRLDNDEGDGEDEARDMSLRVDRSNLLASRICPCVLCCVMLIFPEDGRSTSSRLPELIRGVCGDALFVEINATFARGRRCCSHKRVSAA